jgi:hypothetical protein
MGSGRSGLTPSTKSDPDIAGHSIASFRGKIAAHSSGSPALRRPSNKAGGRFGASAISRVTVRLGSRRRALRQGGLRFFHLAFERKSGGQIRVNNVESTSTGVECLMIFVDRGVVVLLAALRKAERRSRKSTMSQSPGSVFAGGDIDKQGVVWGPLGSGHIDGPPDGAADRARHHSIEAPGMRLSLAGSTGWSGAAYSSRLPFPQSVNFG